MSVLGLDLGEKRVGVAVAEPPSYVAVPLYVLMARPQSALVSALRNLVEERAVKHVVIGLPVELDGSEGKAARECRRLAKVIENELKCPVALVDERFSSVEAEKTLLASDKRRRERRELGDALAATFILDTYLARSKRR